MTTRTAAAHPTPKAYAFDRGALDKISRYLHKRNLVPAALRGTDKFVDLVSWNLRWFDHKDAARIKALTEVLSEINADAFVFTEVAEDGALDEIVELLHKKRAGLYSRAYGKTGSQQRVALMWDRDWLRTKKDVAELFGSENLEVKGDDGRRADVFPRLPLWGYFEARPSDLSTTKEAFTFELVGVHLKSQLPPRGSDVKRGGIAQRSKAAERLASWLENKGEHYDEDVIIAGDWNATPNEPEWEALRKLEHAREISFSKINPEGELSHIARFNKSGPAGTRLDLHAITRESAEAAVPKQTGLVIRWSLFKDLAAMENEERRTLFGTFTHFISDHLPVVSRFYLVDKDGN